MASPHVNTPEISVIQQVSSAVVHQRNTDMLLEQVLVILNREMGMLRGTITLRYGDILRIEASQGLDESEKKLGQYRLGEGITGEVALNGQSIVVPDLRMDKRFLNRTKSRHYKSQVAFICVPLQHSDEVIGTLSIDRPVNEDTDLERDVALLEIIANITGDAASSCIELHAEREQLLNDNRRLRRMLNGGSGELIGSCREMQLVYEQLHQVSSSDVTVLIRGSSGTGKELLARAIVAQSPRRDKPFITMNCAALPENLVESELFGHEKGAFTGAMSRRIGRAEAADGGTLFLDEVGDLTPQTQVKLLRFLQERTFSRVGSNDMLHSDVRFIAATSRNLEELIEQKKFREDLYYRLNIFPITMPDLCRRKSDIILLAEHFMEKMSLKYNKKVAHISPASVNMLLAYAWPGNVRELENCIERAVLTAMDDTIHSYNLPPGMQLAMPSEKNTGTSIDFLLDNYERELITASLQRHDGNISAAGRELGVSSRMMNYRMKRLGITANP